MDYILLKDFIAYYSLPTVIIAIIVGGINFIIYKFADNKIPKTIKNFIPFILSVIIYFAFDAIFIEKALRLKTDTFYAGILCGSLSLIITSAVKKISSGKNLPFNAVALLIESLLESYFSGNALVDAVKVVEGVLNNQTDDLETHVGVALKNLEGTKISEDEIIKLSYTIVKAVNALKKQ